MQEADHGLTQMAMQGQQGRYAADNTLLVRFFKHPKLNDTRSAEEGRPIYEEIDYIQIMSPGNKDSIVQRPADAMDKQRFAEHYAKYQARGSDGEHLDGTPLEDWPGITRSQCEELKFFNIRTVEQILHTADSNAQNIMGFGLLKQKAEAYLNDADANAAKQALADQKRENAELRALITELNDKIDAQFAEEEAPKPKRRRKVAQE
jgi:hypothetical protein